MAEYYLLLLLNIINKSIVIVTIVEDIDVFQFNRKSNEIEANSFLSYPVQKHSTVSAYELEYS